ncbi:MAG: CHC2 zinc finger domain-containing protein [Veillonellales bacterium]
MLQYQNCSTIEVVKQVTGGTEELLSHYLPGIAFKRKGRRLWTCCPVHGEKTASLCLYTDGRLHCFGCGFHGDGLDLIAVVNGMTLGDTIKMVAGDYGLNDTDNRQRQRWREQAAERHRKAEQVNAFLRQSKDCYNRLCTLLRNTYKVSNSIKSESDFDRPDLAAAFDMRTIINWILDDLESDDVNHQYEALARARRYHLWEC